MTLLSEQHHEQFRDQGYVVVEDAVPEPLCDAVVDAMWRATGYDSNDPETWYGPPEGADEQWKWRTMGGVEMYHHQSQWDVRQHPTVYQAFAELLDEHRLWTSFERCNLKPPKHPDHPEFQPLDIHLDQPALGYLARCSSPAASVPKEFPRPYNVQGLVMLNDVGRDEGGTTCVPDLYRDLEEWVDRVLAGGDYSKADINEELLDPSDANVEQITGSKGDLLIWDSLLPHGQAPNLSESYRAATYIRMEPAGFADTTARQSRLEAFDDFRPDPRVSEEGDLCQPVCDRRDWERRNSPVPELTALGEKLLGRSPWPGWKAMANKEHMYPRMFSR